MKEAVYVTNISKENNACTINHNLLTFFSCEYLFFVSIPFLRHDMVDYITISPSPKNNNMATSLTTLRNSI